MDGLAGSESSHQLWPADVLERLRQAARVTVLTGAGMSADSGVPTFRDAETGLWSQVDLEAVATPAGFRSDPERVWAWYAERRRGMDAARPHAGHLALASWADAGVSLSIVTQNIDRLHQRAGSRDVIELHGNLAEARCGSPDPHVRLWSPDEPLPPRCERCGQLLRPNVVWFGELLPRVAVARAEAATLGADVFLVVGTSAVVEPAASLPWWAAEAGALVIEVNPERTGASHTADLHVVGTAAEVLPSLVDAVLRH
jgi:NAD-dependent deacetylase